MLATVIAIKTGVLKKKAKTIKIKNNQRKLYSIFTYGLDMIKDLMFKNKFNQLLCLIKHVLETNIFKVYLRNVVYYKNLYYNTPFLF